MKIGDFELYKDGVYIIAEIGKNHNGDLHKAKTLVEQAYTCGANAVKFQSYTVEGLLHSISPNEPDIEWLRKCELSLDDHKELKRLFDNIGIDFLSTPEDLRFVDFLAELEVKAFKLSSLNVTNVIMLDRMNYWGLPIIASTGMCSSSEVNDLSSKVDCLLHCVSQYPADNTTLNLDCINTMVSEYKIPVGWSDHTGSPLTCWLAVACGASVLEVHFTDDKTAKGPDHCFSFDYSLMLNMINVLRNEVEPSLGDGKKERTEYEQENYISKRRCLVTARDMKKGEVLNRANITCKCPGTVHSLPANYYRYYTNGEFVVTRDMRKDEIITRRNIRSKLK